MEQNDEFTGLERGLWDIAEKMVAEYKGKDGHPSGHGTTRSDCTKILDELARWRRESKYY